MSGLGEHHHRRQAIFQTDNPVANVIKSFRFAGFKEVWNIKNSSFISRSSIAIREINQVIRAKDHQGLKNRSPTNS